MLPITDESFEKKIREPQKLIIVDFWAKWCSPCKSFLPIIECVSKDLDKNTEVFSMDIDVSSETPSKYGVRSIPTLMIFKNKEHLDTRSGIMTKSELLSWIKGWQNIK